MTSTPSNRKQVFSFYTPRSGHSQTMSKHEVPTPVSRVSQVSAKYSARSSRAVFKHPKFAKFLKQTTSIKSLQERNIKVLKSKSSDQMNAFNYFMFGAPERYQKQKVSPLLGLQMEHFKSHNVAISTADNKSAQNK